MGENDRGKEPTAIFQRDSKTKIQLDGEYQVTACNEYGSMPFNAEPQKVLLTAKYIHVTHVLNGFCPYLEEQSLTYKTCFLKQATNTTLTNSSPLTTMRA